MAKGNLARKKEKKKPKKFLGLKGNGKITKSKAMYDNQLVGMQPNIPLQTGY